MLNWLLENWTTAFLVTLALAWIYLKTREQLMLRKFKRKFLPIVQEFHQRYPDYILRVAGQEVLLFHCEKPHMPLIMWNMECYSQTRPCVPSDIALGDFAETAGFLYDNLWNSGWQTIGGISRHMRSGLVAAIQQYELESSYAFQKAQRQLAM